MEPQKVFYQKTITECQYGVPFGEVLDHDECFGCENLKQIGKDIFCKVSAKYTPPAENEDEWFERQLEHQKERELLATA
jgi:hypothetical protein